MRFAFILVLILVALSIVDCHKKKRRSHRRGHDHKHHRRGHHKRGHGHHGHHGFENSALLNPFTQWSGRSGLDQSAALQSRIETKPSESENLDNFPDCYLLDSVSEKCGDHSLNTILSKMKPCADQRLLKKISGHAVRACRRNRNQWMSAARALVDSKGGRFYLDFEKFQTTTNQLSGDQLKESLINHLFKNQRSDVLEPEKKLKSRDKSQTNAEVVNDPGLKGVDKLKVLLSRELEVTSDAPEIKEIQISLNPVQESNSTNEESNESKNQDENEEFDALKYVGETLESAKAKLWTVVNFLKQDDSTSTSTKEDDNMPLINKLSSMLTFFGVLKQDSESKAGDDVKILEKIDENNNEAVEDQNQKTEESSNERLQEDGSSGKDVDIEPVTIQAENEEIDEDPTFDKEDSSQDERYDTEEEQEAVTEENESGDELVAIPSETSSADKDGDSDQERDESSSLKDLDEEVDNSNEDLESQNKTDEPPNVVDVHLMPSERDSDSGQEETTATFDEETVEDNLQKEDGPVIVIDQSPNEKSSIDNNPLNKDGEIFSILVKDESLEADKNAGDDKAAENEDVSPTEQDEDEQRGTEEVEKVLNKLYKEIEDDGNNLLMPLSNSVDDQNESLLETLI